LTAVNPASDRVSSAWFRHARNLASHDEARHTDPFQAPADGDGVLYACHGGYAEGDAGAGFDDSGDEAMAIGVDFETAKKRCVRITRSSVVALLNNDSRKVT
jgi:hypothetical protein